MTDMLNPNGDPRGPMRTIIAVGDTPQTNNEVTLECGHQPDLALHFHYRVGAQMRCFACGPLARPKFNQGAQP